MRDELQRVRDEQVVLFDRLRSVELAMRDVGDGAEGDALRAERSAIGESLAGLQGVIRRLRAVAQQTHAAAEYLLGGERADDDPSTMPTRAWALEAQEEERRRLAREIHDGPAQVLANATFQLEYCQRLIDRDPSRLRVELDRVKADLREGLTEVRGFIFDLRPGPLVELGLPATVRRYAESFSSRSGIEVLLDVDAEQERPALAVEVATFRIIQEAMQNARKHSRAKRIEVSIRPFGDRIRIVVRDDGVGFDASARSESGVRRFGMLSMEERARLIGAELRVESAPGQGTTIELTTPAEAGAPGRE